LNNKQSGEWNEYYENGQLKRVGSFDRNGKKTGKWKDYSSKGVLEMENYFTNGKIVVTDN